MTKPEIRQIVEETRAARSGMVNGDPAIWALLKATDEEGNPDLERRAKGAELPLDHLARLATASQSETQPKRRSRSTRRSSRLRRCGDVAFRLVCDNY